MDRNYSQPVLPLFSGWFQLVALLNPTIIIKLGFMTVSNNSNINRSATTTILCKSVAIFDSVDHNILLKKLETYGIRGLLLRWFGNYLDNRQQQVQCNNKISSLCPIKYGVPQGSILGPLLFMLFINDLPNVSLSMHFELFADDSNVFISHKSHENLFQIINSELPRVTGLRQTNFL